MNTLAIHRFETWNLGDCVSSPCLYFDYGATYMDIRSPTFPEEGNYIFGGGGMGWLVAKRALGQRMDGPKIAWGLGQTSKLQKYITRNPWPDFDLVGTRDIGVDNSEWVPCASCMSPLFDKEYQIEHDVVVYLNSQQRVHKCFPVPTLSNRVGFEEAIKLIGSARVVITTSYHGAYWATLLGRQAIIARPYSCKFRQLKHQPVVGEMCSLPEVYTKHAHLIDTDLPIFPEALEECREANVRFDGKVRQLLS